ncbi:MAG TPA: TRAP transporter small permease subunit [Paenalcaligenes sp.]|nr:TRAP transporter small permease subunit [Paenalcaligenes sp.]
MQFLLRISKLIDGLNNFVGRSVMWLVLVVVFISSLNAISRKLFHVSSNAWLELQWYLFGAIFLLAGGYTLLKNAHVRVDVVANMLSEKKQIAIEIFCTIFFLMPAALIVLYFSWPVFIDSYVSGEVSSNYGGLIRWPAKLLIPIGFTLLILAGISHLIKCVGFLMGVSPNPTRNLQSKTAEEKLAEEIAVRAEIKTAKK